MNKTNIQRVINKEHVLEVASLAHVIWNQHFVSIIGQAQVDYMLQKFQSAEAIRSQIDSGYEYYLASQHGQYVGYMGLVPNDPPGRMMLSKIYLLSEARGTGVGADLIEFARYRSLDVGAKIIWLTVNRDNKAAIHWYKRRGFKVTREAKADIGNGFYMDDYVMEHELVQDTALE